MSLACDVGRGFLLVSSNRIALSLLSVLATVGLHKLPDGLMHVCPAPGHEYLKVDL